MIHSLIPIVSSTAKRFFRLYLRLQHWRVRRLEREFSMLITYRLIAIMLCRLQMTIPDCINAFRSYSYKTFGHRSLRNRLLPFAYPKYNAERLSQGLREVTANFEPERGERIWRQSDFAAPNDQCKWQVPTQLLSETPANEIQWSFCFVGQ